MHLNIRTAAASASIILSSCGGVDKSVTDPEDRALLEYATQSYDKSYYLLRRQDLGTHHGVPVVVEFMCSDICPAYTVRVIHYALKEGQSCAQVNGVEKEILVPISVAKTNKTYCFPKILVEHWDDYRE